MNSPLSSGSRCIEAERPTQVIWLGMPFEEDVADEYPGVSPAGSKWQRLLLKELHQLPGLSLRCVGHVPEPAWPRGRLRVVTPTPDCVWPVHPVSYLNLPVLRMFHLTLGYVLLILRHRDSVDSVISYNSYWYNVIAALAARRISKARWVAVVADVEPAIPGRLAQGWTERLADGCAFLSHRLFVTAGTRRAIHFPGGVEPARATERAEREPADRDRICYAGALTAQAGAFAVAEAVMGMSDPALTLDMFGHGDASRLRRLVRADPRIRVHGLVPKNRLELALAHASVLVNPRATAGHFAETTFPSKLLDYLSYRVPVVSTVTPGMSPEFHDVIVPARSSEPEDLREALCYALRMEPDARRAYRERLDDFVQERTWAGAAATLRRFIAEEVRPSAP